MNSKNRKPLLSRAVTVGAAQAAEQRRQLASGDAKPHPGLVPLDEITVADGDTANGVTRESMNSAAIAALAESIGAVGLLHPPVIDLDQVIVCGRHRRAALLLLRTDKPERFIELFPDQLIPCRVYPFRRSTDPGQAFAIEVTENEKRRDYTPAEIRRIVDSLKSTCLPPSVGRPRAEDAGKPRLLDQLAIVLGKSLATVKRYLAEIDDEQGQAPSAEPLDEANHRRLRQILIDLKRSKQIVATCRRDVLAGTDATLANDLREHLGSILHHLNQAISATAGHLPASGHHPVADEP